VGERVVTVLPELRRRRAAPVDPKVALMRAIMAACKRQGVDNETRRAAQKRITGKNSMTDMTVAELIRLRDHFNRGWNGPKSQRPHVGKIRALWWSLYWIGAIERVDDEALNAFVKRQAHIQHINFLDHRGAMPVIEGLKAWLEREGVMWWSAEQLAGVVATGAMTSAGTPFSQAEADRHAVLSQLAARLDDAGLMNRLALYSWIGNAVGRPTLNQWTFSASELDQALRALGKKYRAHLAKEQRL
jgi:uncharacterized protein YukE